MGPLICTPIILSFIRVLEEGAYHPDMRDLSVDRSDLINWIGVLNSHQPTDSSSIPGLALDAASIAAGGPPPTAVSTAPALAFAGAWP